MSYNTITIKGDPVRIERAAAAAITPGFLIELTSADKFQAHSTAGGSAATIFALEDENQGKEISDAYSTSNEVLAAIFRPGEEAYALLADGENAAIGSKLESNGNGYLRVVDTDASAGDIGVQSVVGIALEALDMSGSSGADPSSQRIRILVI
ncbi:MAG TPA: hypothetical protein ENO22_05730 [candidate division Zixibacteria bacterium]|nr:hypothetical protein [candidate division Zixibacteria bacterium]